MDVFRRQPIGGDGRDIVGPFEVFSLPSAGSESRVKSQESRVKSHGERRASEESEWKIQSSQDSRFKIQNIQSSQHSGENAADESESFSVIEV
jgi:hypothetical protein